MQRTTHNAGEGSGTGKPAGKVFTVDAAGAIADMPSKYFKDVKKRYETGQVLTDFADVVEFHVERLSMHGLPRALDTKHSFLTRLVFTIMTIVAAGAAMYFCAISVREYRKYSYSVVEKVSPVINGTLPALVFCSLEPHIYEFDQEDWLAHAVALEYVTFEEGEELLAKGDFHTQTFAKDLALQRALTSCSVETNSGTLIEDCGVGSKLYQSGFWNVTYSRNVGYCLHYNSKGQAAELALGNPSALVLRLDPRFNMSSETESDVVDNILQNTTGSENLLIATAVSSEIGLDACAERRASPPVSSSCSTRRKMSPSRRSIECDACSTASMRTMKDSTTAELGDETPARSNFDIGDPFAVAPSAATRARFANSRA